MCFHLPEWATGSAAVSRLASETRPLLLEQLQAGRCCPNNPVAVRRDALHEPPIRRVLPDRQLRTRGPPGIHRLLVGASVPSDPFDQVEDEVLDGIGHGRVPAGVYDARLAKKSESAAFPSRRPSAIRPDMPPAARDPV